MPSKKSQLEAVGYSLVAAGSSVGEGGQAIVDKVYKTADGPSSTIYAAKVLKNSGSEQARARFLREIAAIKTIDHPAVVNIVDNWNELNHPTSCITSWNTMTERSR